MIPDSTAHAGRFGWLPIVLLLLAGSAEAQLPVPRNFLGSMRTGVGYTAALPETQLGAGIFHFLGSSRTGVFAEGKLTLGSLKNDESYCPEVIVECVVTWVESERNDFKVRDKDEWLVFNVGATRVLTRELAVMLGGGIVRRTRISEYFDELGEGEVPITRGGNYYVDNPAATGWLGQFVAGVMLRAGPGLALRAGYESGPGGMSIGIYWVLP